ncbi:MAG: hypothetical protein CMK59_05675 [Proteobacteria bacterium]|nr:hypothetical protein [Pseudomonadota bacterium]
MSSDLTAPLRQALLEMIQKKGWNTSSAAKAIDMDRKELKRMLQGKIPLTVNTMIKLGAVLDIQPEDLERLSQAPKTQPPKLQPLPNLRTDDLLNNQPEALIKIGFKMGMSFRFLARTDLLVDSGVPEYILQQFTPLLPIQLDPLYHQHHNPKFQSKGIELTMSFDALYTCFFPWESIQRVVFVPEAPEIVEEDSSSELAAEELSERTAPFLRLVTDEESPSSS